MSAPPTVGAALQAVESWKAQTVAATESRKVEVDGEIAKLRTTLSNLQEQLSSLESTRAELNEVDLDEDLAGRSYAAIFDAVGKQSAALMTRADEFSEAEATRLAAAVSKLTTGDLAPLANDYKQFKETVEPTLAALPESYRGAIAQHHHGVKDQLRAYFARELNQPITMSGENLVLDLVYAIDAPTGKPEVLVCVLPIAGKVFTAWHDRPADLATTVGARVAQALYETTKRTGPSGAQAINGGHQGLLALEVDLEGASADFPKVFDETLRVVLAAAPDLKAAKVTIRPQIVDFDFLLPPEGDEESA